jgi:hypothetical protein
LKWQALQPSVPTYVAFGGGSEAKTRNVPVTPTLASLVPKRYRKRKYPRNICFAPPPAAGLPRGIADRFDLVS